METFERIWPKARQVTKDLTDRLSRKDFNELKRLLDLINGETCPDEDGKTSQSKGKVMMQEEQIAINVR